MARLNLDAACLHVAQATKVEFDHNRALTIGASEIGGCMRRNAMKRQGVAPDVDHVDDPGHAVRGNTIEDHWATPVLTHVAKASGGELVWAGQKNQTTIEWKSKYASCTPDGVFVGMPRDWLAGLGVKKCSPEVLSEVKSITPFITPPMLPKAGHPEQSHFGLGLVRHATDYKPDFALLTYWNCAQFTKYTPIVIPFNPDYFARQLARAKKTCTTPWKKLLAEGKLRGGKDCAYCEFQRTCLGKRSTRSPDVRVPKSTIVTLN